MEPGHQAEKIEIHWACTKAARGNTGQASALRIPKTAKKTKGSVGSTNVTNVTTHAVVFSQQQTSQQHHQHQRQTSNNDKRHRVFSHKNDKCHNVTIFGVVISYFRFVVVHKLWRYLSLRHHFLVLNILQYNLHVNSKYIHRQ